MEKKTAMQDLIDYAIEKYGSDSDVSNDIVVKAMQLKKIEERQIISAWENGKEHKEYGFHISEDSKKYFDETYGNATF